MNAGKCCSECGRPLPAIKSEWRSIGEDLRSERLSRGLLLEDVAHILDRSISGVSQIERGLKNPARYLILMDLWSKESTPTDPLERESEK